jgi:hypothetical protein
VTWQDEKDKTGLTKTDLLMGGLSPAPPPGSSSDSTMAGAVDQSAVLTGTFDNGVCPK